MGTRLLLLLADLHKRVYFSIKQLLIIIHFMKPCIFFHLQQTLQTLIAVVKLTLNSRAQPVATEQAVPPKFNTPLVAGMYVNKHTMYRLTVLLMQGCWEQCS